MAPMEQVSQGRGEWGAEARVQVGDGEGQGRMEGFSGSTDRSHRLEFRTFRRLWASVGAILSCPHVILQGN